MDKITFTQFSKMTPEQSKQFNEPNKYTIKDQNIF